MGLYRKTITDFPANLLFKLGFAVYKIDVVDKVNYFTMVIKLNTENTYGYAKNHKSPHPLNS